MQAGDADFARAIARVCRRHARLAMPMRRPRD